jgi:uncharacterized protein YcbK (DUF882 family)
MNFWDNIKYFKPEEFDCPGFPGSWNRMQIDLIKKLDVLREKCGFPLTISKGGAYRTYTYNKKIGGAENSYHIKGQAVDIKMLDKVQRRILVEKAIELGFTGIIVYSAHIHLDIREGNKILLWGKYA